MLAVCKKKEFNYKKSKPNDRFVFRSTQVFMLCRIELLIVAILGEKKRIVKKF